MYNLTLIMSSRSVFVHQPPPHLFFLVPFQQPNNDAIHGIFCGSTEAGFYIFPVMDNFGLMAKVETWPRILSYFLGGDDISQLGVSSQK